MRSSIFQRAKDSRKPAETRRKILLQTDNINIIFLSTNGSKKLVQTGCDSKKLVQTGALSVYYYSKPTYRSEQ